MIEIKIKPAKGFFNIDLKELWRFRELFYCLSWRDIKVRYKQTSIGIVWAVLQPFLTMVIFSVFFGRVAGISGGEIPYPIFAYSGLLFWNYFTNSLSSASGSLVAEQGIIQKVYFPKIIIPLASSIVFLFDFLFAFIVLVGLMFYYHFFPTFTGILIFLTPVIYPASILGKYQWLMYINPMSGVIETMRTGLLGVGAINWFVFGFSALSSVLLFFLGVLYFKRSERFFADII